MTTKRWDKRTFTSKLRQVGTQNYHHKHPFHVLMNTGQLSPDAIRRWVANRFYYQRNIPIKDAAIVSNCPVREVRRLWLHRISDHDGLETGRGGIEAWLRLASACGMSQDDLWDDKNILPGVRFAVDAYVNFARTAPWPIAISSSLTELFAPDLMAERLAAFSKYYTWVKPWGFDYFKTRVVQARIDSDEGLQLTLKYCDSPQLQQQAVNALSFKCDVLWAILDAIQFSRPTGQTGK